MHTDIDLFTRLDAFRRRKAPFFVPAIAVMAFVLTAPLPVLSAPTAVSASLETNGVRFPISVTAEASIAPAGRKWDLSQHAAITLHLHNPNRTSVTVWARIENAGAVGSMDNCRAGIVLLPGRAADLYLPIVPRPADPTYAPFHEFFMYTKNINIRDNTVDPTDIRRLVVWIDQPAPERSITVESISEQTEGQEANTAFYPFVDRYGQYVHADWPGKIHGDADFAARRAEEEGEMRAYPGPSDWDRWGGWKDGPHQKATGFFYTIKTDGKWWLVDPGGNLFFSYGPTGVSASGEGTPITGRENWFADLPSSGPLARYWGDGERARFMYYQDKSYRTYDFTSANAERKYGKDWHSATVDLLHRRLRNWGFNTIANWSDPDVYARHRTPYVVAIHYGGPWLEHIPDVFDPDFAKTVTARMEQERSTTAGDPWNIGYFVDNELTWGYLDRAETVAQGALRAAPGSRSKQVLVGDLQAKYGKIAALNTAWGSDYPSWDAVLSARSLPEKPAAAMHEDLGAFGLKFADKYFSTVRDIVKRIAPDNLYLGCRFAGQIDLPIIQTAAKYCDIISYNVYDKQPGDRLNRYLGVVDKPFIVGEFGIGSDPGQTPFRGDTLSEDPELRVRQLEVYVRQAMSYPLLVGAHYFQFRDQPISGRPDGEAVLRGFLNTADTPHFDLVQLNRRLGYALYATRGAKAASVSRAAVGRRQTPAPKLAIQRADGVRSIKLLLQQAR